MHHLGIRVGRYLATLVHGAETRERDEDTGARPGRLAPQQPRG
jgi:hypothetical protein